MKKLLCIILSFCLCCPMVNTFADTITSKGVTLQSDTVRKLPKGENLLSGKVPLYVDYIPPNKSYTERTMLPQNTNMTDGDVGTNWIDYKKVFADYNNGDPIIYSNGEAQCRIIYFLEKVTDITKICLINHTYQPLMTGKYEIYASKDLRTLFWRRSLVASIENFEPKDRQILDCDFKDIIFVAINVIYPAQPDSKDVVLKLTETTNNHYPRINEFAIYGTEGEKSEYPVIKNECSKTIVSKTTPVSKGINITDNFLYQKTPEAYCNSGSGEIEIELKDTTSLTDGYTENSTDWRVSALKFAKRDQDKIVSILGSDSYYVDVRLDAGEQKELGMFYIKHHSTLALRTYHYKIFASSSMNNLTSDSSLIAECYNTDASQEQYFMVANGETVKARYYTIRVYDPCFDYSGKVLASTLDDGTITNSYLRLLEVAAYTPETISAELKLDGFNVVDGKNYGYITPGLKVKSINNAFCGYGDVHVVSADGKIKSPSEVLKFGDKVIADAAYGKNATAGFKFRGDLDDSNSYSVSDIWRLVNSIMKQNTDPETSDLNSDGKVGVTDMMMLTDIVVGNSVGIEDNSPNPLHGPKNGADGIDEYEVKVDTNTILKENFRGFGVNSFTATLTKEGMGLGINEDGKWNGRGYPGFNLVYHELNKKRLASMKPSVSRVWFQVDWIVTDTLGDKYTNYETNWKSNPDYINYKNGIYDFDNELMQAFYDYIEMLDSIGCTIDVNFGWKTATRIKDWFNDPNVTDYKIGAPRDLPAFGKAAAALIKHLNEVKGYDFIEAITFYNEPNIGDFERDVEGDMDERIYWSQLVHAVDAALEENKMRDKVEIWGPEVSGMTNEVTKDWFQYQLDNTSTCVDQWTGHCYLSHAESNRREYNINFDTFLYYAEKTAGNMMITEMYGAVSNDIYKDWYDWNDSFAGYFIGVSNSGLNGLCAWSVVGGYLPNPLYMNLNTKDSGAWMLPQSKESAATVQRIFYEESLFTNYVPDGSKVLYTDWIGKNIKASSYLLPDGNITVVVENNGINDNAVLSRGEGSNKTVKINIGDGIDRTFKRISYIADSQEINANATVNRPDRIIEAKDGKFSDTLGDHYSVHIYTTAPTVKQVEMMNVFLHVKPGKSTDVSGVMLDCDVDDEIVYSITEHTGTDPGTILQDGVYTAASTAKSGDMVAVRASLKSNPKVFGVSIIYIN